MQASFEISAEASGAINVQVQYYGAESSLFLPARMVCWWEIIQHHRMLFDFSRLDVDRFEVV